MNRLYFCQIHGCEPVWRSGIQAIEQSCGRPLRSLIGARLEAVWLLEDSDAGWWADTPVNLDFGRIRAEICHTRFNELSISFDTIDPSRPVPSHEHGAPDLCWRDDLRREPKTFVGRRLQGVSLLETAPLTPDLANGVVSVQFEFAGGQLTIYNALDENGLSTEPPHPHQSRHRL